MDSDPSVLPSSADFATVQVHALSGGHFTLPEEQFIRPATPGARKTVPSLCFLIEHTGLSTGVKTRIVFDLGLRRDIDRYSQPIRRHIATRQPLTTDPDVVKSLASGGLRPEDIDFIIFSHVHWDDVGGPRDFPSSTFVVGNGALDVLHGKHHSLRGGHSFFEADLLDPSRTIQLSDPREGPDVDSMATSTVASATQSRPDLDFLRPWKPFAGLPATLDLFGDGSLYIVDAPGHLPGHINLLARTAGDGWLYLAGDTCHDRRILDVEGRVCCIHADRGRAEETILRIKSLEQKGVEVIFAHDVEWESKAGNQHRECCKMAPDRDRAELKKQFDSQLGPEAFHEGWASLLSLDPPFFSASLSLASVPRRKSHLSRKNQELISLAVDSAATHLYAPGIRKHVSAALKEGASVDEVLEVIELSSTLGIHACNIGVPLLVEVLKEEGKFAEEITRPYDENQERLKKEFTDKRGYWHAFWEDFLRLDPEFFEAYLNFSSVPWTKRLDGSSSEGRGALGPKMKELIYCAFDAASTHLYVPGLKLHMKNALGYGASPQEILEVLEIATLLSLHTPHVAAPIIEELTSTSSWSYSAGGAVV
ncbi:Metallo-hydrolase/oxidoreductase [Achaetomium macrosporum]|uniref:Metallo-hydrolase/oxidoreductase n=1 Tax=Achaetomium macrosporum TaxID=79813 RepID=A0AAN7HDE2_9PEZI|nr:Metallo-hydrolase/oxidoreductase [Achaetomium macrosporum]